VRVRARQLSFARPFNEIDGISACNPTGLSPVETTRPQGYYAY